MEPKFFQEEEGGVILPPRSARQNVGWRPITNLPPDSKVGGGGFMKNIIPPHIILLIWHSKHMCIVLSKGFVERVLLATVAHREAATRSGSQWPDPPPPATVLDKTELLMVLNYKPKPTPTPCISTNLMRYFHFRSRLHFRRNPSVQFQSFVQH